MSGTVNIARALWDDPTFKDSEMSQREAWCWMIAEASWKPRQKRAGTKTVDLARGQLLVSSRFLAKAWMWSEPRVRRYLDMLENRRMIERVTDAGQTIVTICKYNEYQNAPRVDDAPVTQQPTHQRRTADANYNKGEIKDILPEPNGSGRDASEDDLSKQIFDRGVAFLGKHGTAEKQARSFIGKLRRDYPDSEIFAAFVACGKAGPVDPIPWLTASLGRAANQSRQIGVSHDRPATPEQRRRAEHRASIEALHHLADGLGDGTIHIDTRSRDPFAGSA